MSEPEVGWYSGRVYCCCRCCANTWVAVWSDENDPEALECPDCGELRSTVISLTLTEQPAGSIPPGGKGLNRTLPLQIVSIALVRSVEGPPMIETVLSSGRRHSSPLSGEEVTELRARLSVDRRDG